MELDNYTHTFIEGYEGRYSITTCGKIYSHKTNRFMADRQCEYGYRLIVLSTPTTKPKSFRIHRLVAQAFLPNPEDHPYVNHIDANRSNNDISNLEWISPKANHAHAVALGNIAPDKPKRDKLHHTVVAQIKSRYSHRCPTNGRHALAAEFGVSRETIRRIVNGYSYCDIEPASEPETGTSTTLQAVLN